MKALKFLVVFMGVLIIIGIITLSISLINKINNKKFYSYDLEKDNSIILNAPNYTTLKSLYSLNNTVAIEFEGINESVILLLDPKTGKTLQKIIIKH